MSGSRKALLQIGRITIGYIGAVATGSALVSLVIFAFLPDPSIDNIGRSLEAIYIFSTVGFFIFLIPSVLIITATEFFSISSRKFFISTGFFVAIVSVGLIVLAGSRGNNNAKLLSLDLILMVTTVVISGLAAGYVYWWLAGRFAGSWLPAPAASSGHSEA